MGAEHALAYPDDAHPEDTVDFQSTDLVEHTPTQAIQPVTHHEPTHQQISPRSNLAALLADIPSTVHIENLQFSLSQNTVLHNGVNVAAVQEYVQQTNGVIAQLHEMMHAQF